MGPMFQHRPRQKAGGRWDAPYTAEWAGAVTRLQGGRWGREGQQPVGRKGSYVSCSAIRL